MKLKPSDHLRLIEEGCEELNSQERVAIIAAADHIDELEAEVKRLKARLNELAELENECGLSDSEWIQHGT